MKRSILTIAAVLFFAASAVNAADFYFTDHDGNQSFSDPNNWYSDCSETSAMNAIPGANDRVIICPPKTCHVDVAATVETVWVQDTASLNVWPSYTLTLNNWSSSDSVVDGTITLEASSPDFGHLAFTTNNHELTGNGLIFGQNYGCTITLDSDDQVLTNNTTISGELQITESGDPNDTSFVNGADGLVLADADGTLAITLVDSLGSPTGDWQVSTDEDAILKIDVLCTTMSGNFYVELGKLEINANVWTQGDLNFTSGTIQVADDVSFKTGQDAAVYYFHASGGSGNANDPNNWYTDNCEEHSAQDGQVPGVDDRGVICSGQTCYVTTNTTWDTANIQGTLNIQPGYTLTLQNDNNNLGHGAGNDHSVVDGTVNLQASGTYGVLAFEENDHELAGSGSIIGADDNCQIMLGNDYLDLTSSITIRGALAIVESGSQTDTSFINNGTVSANLASGTLELAVDYLDDGTCSTGNWTVSASSAVLQFGVGSTLLSGNFSISNGTLDIDADVWTEGDMSFTGGTIDVADGASFKVNQSLGCS
jgi:hypothetical protein